MNMWRCAVAGIPDTRNSTSTGLAGHAPGAASTVGRHIQVQTCMAFPAVGFFFFYFIYLFLRDTQREAET